MGHAALLMAMHQYAPEGARCPVDGHAPVHTRDAALLMAIHQHTPEGGTLPCWLQSTQVSCMHDARGIAASMAFTLSGMHAQSHACTGCGCCCSRLSARDVKRVESFNWIKLRGKHATPLGNQITYTFGLLSVISQFSSVYAK